MLIDLQELEGFLHHLTYSKFFYFIHRKGIYVIFFKKLLFVCFNISQGYKDNIFFFQRHSWIPLESKQVLNFKVIH